MYLHFDILILDLLDQELYEAVAAHLLDLLLLPPPPLLLLCAFLEVDVRDAKLLQVAFDAPDLLEVFELVRAPDERLGSANKREAKVYVL